MSKKNKQAEQVEQPQVDSVADQVVEQAVEQVAEQVPEQEQAPEAGDVDTSAGEQAEQVQDAGEEVAVVDEPTPEPEQARDMTFAEVMAWNAANRHKTPPVHAVQKKQQRKMTRF